MPVYVKGDNTNTIKMVFNSHDSLYIRIKEQITNDGITPTWPSITARLMRGTPPDISSRGRRRHTANAGDHRPCIEGTTANDMNRMVKINTKCYREDNV